MTQYFTKEGLQKLKDELHYLETVENKRIVGLLAEAASFGDLKENAAYHDAREKLSFLRGRIEQLKNAINEAVIKEKTETGKIEIGSSVVILLAGDEEKFEIVAPTEADILKNKISYESPLGKELIGKKSGDEFDFKSGKVKVLKIS